MSDPLLSWRKVLPRRVATTTILKILRVEMGNLLVKFVKQSSLQLAVVLRLSWLSLVLVLKFNKLNKQKKQKSVLRLL